MTSVRSLHSGLPSSLSSKLARSAHFDELTGPLPPLAIPATLQDSLMARLDRFAPVKEVAQIGAVIGRELSCTTAWPWASPKPSTERRWRRSIQRFCSEVFKSILPRRGHGSEASRPPGRTLI